MAQVQAIFWQKLKSEGTLFWIDLRDIANKLPNWLTDCPEEAHT